MSEFEYHLDDMLKDSNIHVVDRDVLLQAHKAAIDQATKDALKRIWERVKAEFEDPDGMPDEIWDAIKGDRDAMEKTIRTTVHLTKRAIIDAIKVSWGQI